MEITEVRIKLMDNSEDRLRAFCSVTFDNCFVIRDLKIIEGNTGPFVAMPSRKLSAHCRSCNSKNHLRARFCNNCGTRQSGEKVGTDDHGRAKLYADIAHPINAEAREQIQSRVIKEFFEELEHAKKPDYVSRYDDEYSDGGNRSNRSDAKHRERQGPHSVEKATEKTAAGSEEEDKPAARSKHADGNFGNGIF
ncbi:MAG: SpoVG family protein [Pirellulaceae bacterium]|nr:SpoVG family protein [Pirellulaceae bacterium]